MSGMRVGQFSSELLRGAEHLAVNQRHELCVFFAAVAEQRGFPLHTAVLWNSLYFGWDLESGEYLGRGVRIEEAEDGTPIPVGAFVDIPPKTSPLYGEVIYKEGREGRVYEGTGLVDAEVSGSRSGLNALGQPSTVKEALILDFNAFGTDFHEYDQVDFQRFVRRARLDEHHHRVVTATYQPGEPADDLSIYAHYLLSTYGHQLFAEFLTDGDTLTDDDIRDLLLRSFETIHQIAKECPDLVRIGDYHIAKSVVDAALAAGPEAPLSGHEIGNIARRVADLSPRSNCAYSAVGPMALSHLSLQGLTDEEKLMLRGPGWARLVCVLNAAVAGQVGEEGLLPDERHLRLDDDWNWGGIWRVERYHGEPPSHSRFHPLMPLGLGYASTTDNLPSTPPRDESEPMIDVNDQQWTVTLRRVDIEYGDLPLSAAAIAELPNESRILMETNIVGVRSLGRTNRPIDRERRLLRDINYPPEFFPGVQLRCSLTFGGKVVLVRAHPLPVPVQVEGAYLTLEHNLEVYKREMRLVPTERKHFKGTRTLADQIATVFRLHGRETDDGGKALTAEEILGRLLGSDVVPGTAHAILIALSGMDLEYDAGVYTWRPRLTRRTSARERVTIQAARSSEGGQRLTRRIARHMVAMHLRRYTARQPSAHKIATYRQALIDHNAAHRLPEILPNGCTWVVPYRVGARQGD